MHNFRPKQRMTRTVRAFKNVLSFVSWFLVSACHRELSHRDEWNANVVICSEQHPKFETQINSKILLPFCCTWKTYKTGMFV